MLSPRFNQREWRKRERANECTLSLKATQRCRDRQKEQMQGGREGGKNTSGTDWKNRKGNVRLAEAGEYGAERRDGECESRVWSLYLPFTAPPTFVLSLSLSIYLSIYRSPSLFALPGESLSIMCGDSVRRWRIIPVFRAATARPSFSSSSSSSSSLSTPLTSHAWISLYHLSQPRLCHSASFAQREVWKVCVYASVRECVPTCVMISVCECNCVYMCLCMLASLCTCVCVVCGALVDCKWAFVEFFGDCT